jgi:hypothetical protein
MDRVYKHDIPAKRKALEQLSKEFSRIPSRTDWKKLRVQPLLAHVRALERLIQSPRFARETSRLPKGVVMFRSDLIYLRENIKALDAILVMAKKALTPKRKARHAATARPR